MSTRSSPSDVKRRRWHGQHRYELRQHHAVLRARFSIRSPDGVQFAAANHGNAATGNLIALRFPKTGWYTLWISPQRGAGDYGIRLIDGDWGKAIPMATPGCKMNLGLTPRRRGRPRKHAEK